MTSKVLRLKAQEFLASRKNANNLVDIIATWEAHPVACLLTVENIFVELLRRGDLHVDRTSTLAAKEATPESRYRDWLHTCYQECWEKVLSVLDNPHEAIQSQALSTSLKLLAAEGKQPLESWSDNAYYFPVYRLKAILARVLSSERENSQLIGRYLEVASYKDGLHFTWKCLPSVTPKRQPRHVYVRNLLEFVHKMPMPRESKSGKNGGVEDEEEEQLLCGPQPAANEFTCDFASAKKSLNKVWSCIMHWELTPQLHKQLLVVLLERVMPHLEKPVLMTDFLMDSLDVAGPVSLLALQGVFVLVTKHNLEYPNIFTKLYSMFEPEIFHTKFKARLFYLSDLFLSSTHLPEALVAAFAKRLSRLTLVAPPEDVLIILLFIGNLILRHPGLKRLIDHPDNTPKLPSASLSSYPASASASSSSSSSSSSPGSNDPYLMEEREPLQSNALQSSLWEVKALQFHVLPSVATAARFIREPLPRMEYDMASALERTAGHIFERELRSKVKDIMLTFERPSSMALTKGERLLQYWQLASSAR